MDLQGNPLPHGPRSTKVTNDPEASRNPISEPSGPVPGDSLAAESSRHGGAFSQNRGAEPDAATSKSTLNNNLSSATELPPAPVGGLREDSERQERYPEGMGGQGDFPGAHHSGYTGGPTEAKRHLAQKHAQASGSTTGYGGGHEGGNTDFPEDPKYNASFNSDIGSKNDPGRAAEHSFQRVNADSGVDAGYTHQKAHIDNQHPYQALSRDQRA